MINGATQLAVTCLDRLFKDASGARSWNALPAAAKEFVERLENELRVPVTIISTGADIENVVDMRAEKI
jgi:adenylosuccinate synthase